MASLCLASYESWVVGMPSRSIFPKSILADDNPDDPRGVFLYSATALTHSSLLSQPLDGS